MKDTEMHNNLPDKEIRDYFSTSLMDIYNKELELNKTYNKNKQDIYKIGVKKEKLGYIRKEITLNELDMVFYTERNKLLTNRLAISILIQQKGWDEFDVSDDIICTGENYMSFIGTKEELHEILEQIAE